MVRAFYRTMMLTAAASAATMATSASATEFIFSLTGQAIAPTAQLGASACPTSVPKCTTAQQLNVTAYGRHLNSTGTGGTSTVSTANVAEYKGAGLGVLFDTDKDGDSTHQFDNAGGGSDFVALVFDQNVTIASILRGNYSNLLSSTGFDTDVSYMAFGGALSDLSKGLKLADFSYLDSGATKTNSTALSKIWLVGTNVRGDTDDAFKLTSLVVNTAPGAVPEPATWAMMLVGFGGIGFAMRRRKNKVTTTVAYA